MVRIDLGMRGKYMAEIKTDDPTPTPTRLQILATIGRDVHYMARGSADGVYPPICRAAIVTAVDPDDESGGTLLLCVLNPTGIFFNRTEYDPAGAPGTWHWPERA